MDIISVIIGIVIGYLCKDFIKKHLVNKFKRNDNNIWTKNVYRNDLGNYNEDHDHISL